MQKTDISYIIKGIRLDMGLTQKEFAALMGLRPLSGKVILNRYESGTRKPRAARIAHMKMLHAEYMAQRKRKATR